MLTRLKADMLNTLRMTLYLQYQVAKPSYQDLAYLAFLRERLKASFFGSYSLVETAILLLCKQPCAKYTDGELAKE